MKRLTYSFVKNTLLQKNITLLSDEYVNNNTKLKCKCNICDNIWFSIFNNVKRTKCPKCDDNNKKLTYSFVKQFLFEKHIELLSKDYKNCMEKIECKCIICNTIWFPIFNNIKSHNHGCPVCARDKFKKTCLDRYGCENPTQNKDIALRQAKSQKRSVILNHWKTNEELVCQASYEIAVVEHLNKNKIDFDWQIKFDMPNGKKYFVDLYLKEQDKYVEIKGYFYKNALEKWNWFHSVYFNSELWNESKLKQMEII